MMEENHNDGAQPHEREIGPLDGAPALPVAEMVSRLFGGYGPLALRVAPGQETVAAAILGGEDGGAALRFARQMLPPGVPMIAAGKGKRIILDDEDDLPADLPQDIADLPPAKRAVVRLENIAPAPGESARVFLRRLHGAGVAALYLTGPEARHTPNTGFVEMDVEGLAE